MRYLLAASAAALVLTGCGGKEKRSVKEAGARTEMPNNPNEQPFLVDGNINPADDFYKHVNSPWMNANKLPADKSVYGQFHVLRDKVIVQKRTLIEEILKKSDRDDLEEKAATLYSGYMDEAKIESLGLTPIAAYLSEINAVTSFEAFFDLQAKAERASLGGKVFSMQVEEDPDDPTIFCLRLTQGPLGLPNRDYYLEQSEKFAKFRDEYTKHIDLMFEFAGMNERPSNLIMTMEAALAEIQWAEKDRRDIQLTNNRIKRVALDKVAPGVLWERFFVALGLAKEVNNVMLHEKSFFEKLGSVLTAYSLQDWQVFLKWHLLRGASGLLPKKLKEQNFRFYSTVLGGIKVEPPRSEKATDFVEALVGEGLGKAYVARFFSEEAKSKVQDLVKNLLKAYEVSIESRTWLSEETKARALEKLAKINVKIGYPEKFKSYENLNFAGESVLQHAMATSEFAHKEEIAKVGNKVDKERWLMTPQTVNAYYNPAGNEIVFPAAILQAPFFSLNSEDAINYGGIGMVIGHEIGHAFDDQGCQYDGDGRLNNWWTDADLQKFNDLTQGLVDQYSKYEPVKGYHVDGSLTLGENIGDLGGVSIAYKAYQLSRKGGQEHNRSDAQKFFLGVAQIWATVASEQYLIRQVKTDPHAPAEYRVNGVLRNVDAFYEAFNVQPENGMYLPPEDRVVIW